MLRSQFVAQNRHVWRELSALLDRAERSGLRSLKPNELDRLGSLYRHAAAHLSQARTTGVDEETTGYLNQLVGRAYTRIYAGSRPRRLGIIRLFAVDVPRTFRRRGGYVAVSGAILIIAALASYQAVRSDPGWADALASTIGMPEGPDGWRARANELSSAGEYFAPTASMAGGSEFSAFLITNNVRVALTAFALGLTLGFGTVYILIVTGVMIGLFLSVGANAGEGLMFAAIVTPHGVIELSAIILAGGAGLMLGHAIVDPGDLYRRDALRIAAQDAFRLIASTVPMFIVAGLIEGLISPQTAGLFASDVPRLLFGLAAGAAFWLYLLRGGRKQPQETPRPNEAPAP